MSEHYIEFDMARKSYGSGVAQTNALSDASFHVNKGEFCVLLAMKGGYIWVKNG